jgi:AhpD family alkylhydroperoxidase
MLRSEYSKIAPEGFNHFLATGKYISGSGLDEKLIHMIYLRVSQINGCPYCVDMHWKDAKAAGEDLRKLNAVVIWRDTPFFSEAERAALAWAESVTRLEHQSVPEGDFHPLKNHFNEKQIVDLTFAVCHMNALNRIAIAFHAMPAA